MTEKKLDLRLATIALNLHHRLAMKSPPYDPEEYLHGPSPMVQSLARESSGENTIDRTTARKYINSIHSSSPSERAGSRSELLGSTSGSRLELIYSLPNVSIITSGKKRGNGGDYYGVLSPYGAL